MTRHVYVPDTQVRPGVTTDHLAWVSAYIVEKLPDSIIVGGDWWDFPSLSSYEQPGGMALEGARVQDDIEVGNLNFKNFCAPIKDEIQRQRKNRLKKIWQPRCEFTDGNHEDRADRVASSSAKWQGVIGSDKCDTQFFVRRPFLEIVWIDGVAYSHYFANQHSGKPIGGTAQNRLTKIGSSFVQGHQQGLDMGLKVLGNGKTIAGTVAGSCYVHIEKYRGRQGQQHFRGIMVLNEVQDGGYLHMPVSLDFLCRKYEGMTLHAYHKAKYPNQDWEHLL
jgi:hypothetical protein